MPKQIGVWPKIRSGSDGSWVGMGPGKIDD